MNITFEPSAHHDLINLANDGSERGAEIHAYLIGHRRDGNVQIAKVLRPGKPLEHATMARPDYSAAATAIRPYLDRGYVVVGEAHSHLYLVGPSAGDRQMLLDIQGSYPGYLCVVVAVFPDGRAPVITAQSVENGEIVEHDVQIRPEYAALLPETVADLDILQIGVGSGGSLSLLQIAKFGARTITVADGDRFEKRNFKRHLAPRKTRGNKALWAAKFLRQQTTSAVVAIPLNVTPDNRDDLAALIRSHSIISNGTGHPLASILISEACVQEKKVCIHAAAFARGSGGFVFLQTPDGPCYECLYQLDLKTVSDDKLTMETLQQQYGYSPEELEAQVGLWADVNVIAAIQTKVLIEYLKHGATSPNLYLIDNTNITLRKVRVQRRATCRCQKGEHS